MPVDSKLCSFWAGLFCLLPIFLGAQTLPPRITVYSPSDYEGHNQVLASELLPDGRAVFGTGKILFHHGEGFDDVDLPSGKLAFSLERGPSGRILVGGQELMGVILPDSTGTLNYRSLTPLLPDSIEGFGIVWNAFCKEGEGIYFQTQDRVFYFNGNAPRVIQPHEERGFYGFFSVAGEPFVQDLGKGIYRLKGGERKKLPLSSDSLHNKGVQAVFPHEKGSESVWTVFTKRSGIYRYLPSSGESQLLMEASGFLEEKRIWAVERLKPEQNPYEAAYAVGTKTDGVHLLGADLSHKLHLGEREGLPAELVWDMSVDERGNIWAATDNGIALLHTGMPFTFALEESSYFKGGVVDIERPSTSLVQKDEEGTPLYLATAQGAWQWKEGKRRFERLKGTAGRRSDLEPFEDPEGKVRMLIGGAPAGLLSTGGLGEDGISEGAVDTVSDRFTIGIDRFPFPNGNGVIITGREGFFVLSPSDDGTAKWEEHVSLEDPPAEWVSFGWEELATTKDSIRVWCGSRTKGTYAITLDTGLSGYHIEQFGESKGMSKGEVSVFPDLGDEELLFGTHKGLLSYEDGRFHSYCKWGSRFCDSSRQVFKAKAGMDGEIWVNEWMHDGSGEGLSHLKPEDGEYSIDSLPFEAMKLGGIRAIHPEQGRTWVGGDRGLACYYPDVERDHEREWHCRIREVKGVRDTSLFGGTFSKKRGAFASFDSVEGWERAPVSEQPSSMVPKLPFEENRLEFRFSAPYPDRQESVEYSYRLEGFDTVWSQWTHEPRKEYTNLPGGRYRFKVKARNVYGLESLTASYSFRILVPWYRTWPAYSGYSVLGILFIWLVAWLNGRRLAAQKEALEQLVNNRTREIQEEKRKVELQQEETQKQKERVEEAHREIDQSIDYAQRIQEALIQNLDPGASSSIGHFALFKPKDKISGDIYWIREHGGDLYVAAIDCTGHGVPGAMMSMLAVSALNEIISREGSMTPGWVLGELRERVIRELAWRDREGSIKDGMDAGILRIVGCSSNAEEGVSSSSGEKGRKVEYAGAQNVLYVLREGIADAPPQVYSNKEEGVVPEAFSRAFKRSSDGIELKGDRHSVAQGEWSEEAFRTLSIDLEKGDMLYLFTDGFPDQFGGKKGKKFGYRSFQELLAQLYHRSLEEQKAELNHRFEEWRGESNQEQTDDVLVIGVSL